MSSKKLIRLSSLKEVLQQMAGETGEPIFAQMAGATEKLIAEYGANRKVPVELAETIVVRGLKKTYNEKA